MRAFINFHVFAEVSSIEEALSVGSNLSHLLPSFTNIRILNIKQYWKIPEYFDFSIELENPNVNEKDCAAVASILGTGWTTDGGVLVWNFAENLTFVDSRVKWASLEFIKKVS